MMATLPKTGFDSQLLSASQAEQDDVGGGAPLGSETPPAQNSISSAAKPGRFATEVGACFENDGAAPEL